MDLPEIIHHFADSRVSSSDSGGAKSRQELPHGQQTRRLVAEHVKQDVFDILLVDFTLTVIRADENCKFNDAKHVIRDDNKTNSLAEIPVFDKT